MANKADEERIDSILKKIYYDLSTAGSYLGPDKIYTIIKTKASQTLENTQFENGCKIKIITVFKNQFVKHLRKQELLSLESMISSTPIWPMCPIYLMKMMVWSIFSSILTSFPNIYGFSLWQFKGKKTLWMVLSSFSIKGENARNSGRTMVLNWFQK